MQFSKIILTLLISSCSFIEEKPSEDNLYQVRKKVVQLEEQAQSLETSQGWLVSVGCDSMLWASKVCDGMDLTAAEEFGRLYRRPAKDCFIKDRDYQDSKSSFSRDMGIGAAHCAHRQGNLELVERHIEYGEAHGWVMGEGVLSRTVYSPFLISLWYRVAKDLGHNYKKLKVPNILTKGLTDYQAALQMLGIYTTGKLDNKISKTMLKRIIEHKEREPNNTFYHALYGKYSGDKKRAIELCLDDSNIVGSYVRCTDEQTRCDLAERIFSCRIILE